MRGSSRIRSQKLSRSGVAVVIVIKSSPIYFSRKMAMCGRSLTFALARPIWTRLCITNRLLTTGGRITKFNFKCRENKMSLQGRSWRDNWKESIENILKK